MRRLRSIGSDTLFLSILSRRHSVGLDSSNPTQERAKGSIELLLKGRPVHSPPSKSQYYKVLRAALDILLSTASPPSMLLTPSCKTTSMASGLSQVHRHRSIGLQRKPQDRRQLDWQPNFPLVDTTSMVGQSSRGSCKLVCGKAFVVAPRYGTTLFKYYIRVIIASCHTTELFPIRDHKKLRSLPYSFAFRPGGQRCGTLRYQNQLRGHARLCGTPPSYIGGFVAGHESKPVAPKRQR
jgi:hypothetical protein